MDLSDAYDAHHVTTGFSVGNVLESQLDWNANHYATFEWGGAGNGWVK